MKNSSPDCDNPLTADQLAHRAENMQKQAALWAGNPDTRKDKGMLVFFTDGEHGLQFDAQSIDQAVQYFQRYPQNRQTFIDSQFDTIRGLMTWHGYNSAREAFTLLTMALEALDQARGEPTEP